jgi:hypothetical protein
LTSILGLDPNKFSSMPGSLKNFKNLKSWKKTQITIH